MKFCATIIFLTLFTSTAMAQTIVKLKDAHKHFGKQIIITGTLCDWQNSDKMQAAWLLIGPDSTHKQIQVVVQGPFYLQLNFSKTGQGANWIGAYLHKTVQVTGVVRGNHDEVYLEAIGVPTLKQE
jgi:hypothetical protein